MNAGWLQRPVYVFKALSRDSLGLMLVVLVLGKAL